MFPDGLTAYLCDRNWDTVKTIRNKNSFLSFIDDHVVKKKYIYIYIEIEDNQGYLLLQFFFP